MKLETLTKSGYPLAFNGHDKMHYFVETFDEKNMEWIENDNNGYLSLVIALSDYEDEQTKIKRIIIHGESHDCAYYEMSLANFLQVSKEENKNVCFNIYVKVSHVVCMRGKK